MKKLSVIRRSKSTPIIDSGNINFSYSKTNGKSWFSKTKYSQLLNAAYHRMSTELDDDFHSSNCYLNYCGFDLKISRIGRQEEFRLAIIHKKFQMKFILSRAFLRIGSSHFSYDVYFNEPGINSTNRDKNKNLNSFLTWAYLALK